MVCATEAGPHGNFARGPPCSGMKKGWREEMEKPQQRLIMTLRHTIEGRTCLRQIFAKGEEMRYVTQSTVSAVTLYPTNVIDYGDPCSLPLSLARFPFNCRDLEEGSLEKCLHFLVLYAFSS